MKKHTFIKQYLGNLNGQITFKFNDKDCGVDPIAHDEYNMWYGDENYAAKAIDEVFDTPFFGGSALKGIIDEVENLEY